MSHVAIIGCGVVGAAIAYELSRVPGLTVTVLDRQSPAGSATRAALGVLMGVISQKAKGRNWQLRRESVERYDALIDELEAVVARPIPYNRNGILKLCFEGDDLERWQSLAQIRQRQGFDLKLLSTDEVRSRYPYLHCDRVIGAVYSPGDRQVAPVPLTEALVEAARANGVNFRFDTQVSGAQVESQGSDRRVEALTLNLDGDCLPVDWAIVAAGLGSTPFTAALSQPVEIGAVLGQAMRVRLNVPLAEARSQPAITGDDIHIVPLGKCEYWIGATVEFPNEAGEVAPDPQQLEAVLEGAIEFCPAIKNAQILDRWFGLRPRPQGQPAPVIKLLDGYQNVWLATGHYRNGILMAPATANRIRAAIAPN